MRSHDLVVRLSGDEFVLVIHPSERDSVASLASRLLALIAQDIVYRGQLLSVGASLGIYFVDSVDEDIDTIMKSADSAMYQAKCSGKGRFVLIDKAQRDQADS